MFELEIEMAGCAAIFKAGKEMAVTLNGLMF